MANPKLRLSFDPGSISITDSGQGTATATVTDSFGNPVEGATLVFDEGNSTGLVSISGDTVTAKWKGTAEVYAVKDGYTNSDPVTIQITDSRTGLYFKEYPDTEVVDNVVAVTMHVGEKITLTPNQNVTQIVNSWYSSCFGCSLNDGVIQLEALNNVSSTKKE